MRLEQTDDGQWLFPLLGERVRVREVGNTNSQFVIRAEHVKQWGPVVILSDGDVVFQPRKVERSGLLEAVDGNALIYVHKEKEFDDVEQRYPAEHYVMVDDKLRILTAMKNIWHDRVTTVFPRQGHYALDAKAIANYPPADLTVERIGELVNYDLASFAGAKRE